MDDEKIDALIKAFEKDEDDRIHADYCLFVFGYNPLEE